MLATVKIVSNFLKSKNQRPCSASFVVTFFSFICLSLLRLSAGDMLLPVFERITFSIYTCPTLMATSAALSAAPDSVTNFLSLDFVTPIIRFGYRILSFLTDSQASIRFLLTGLKALG